MNDRETFDELGNRVTTPEETDSADDVSLAYWLSRTKWTRSEAAQILSGVEPSCVNNDHEPDLLMRFLPHGNLREGLRGEELERAVEYSIDALRDTFSRESPTLSPSEWIAIAEANGHVVPWLSWARGRRALAFASDRQASDNFPRLLSLALEARHQFFHTYENESTTPADKGEVVIKWLLEKTDVSGKAAEAINLIIRPDAAKRGGRRKKGG